MRHVEHGRHVEILERDFVMNTTGTKLTSWRQLREFGPIFATMADGQVAADLL